MRLSVRRLRRGFTLVEVMLALVIFTSVMIAIYSIWSSILRSTRVGQEAAASAQRERMAVQALEQALFSIRMFQENVRYYAFLADTRSDFAALSFAAHLPPSFPRSGRYEGQPLRRVSFEVIREAGGDQALVVRQTPLLQPLDVDEEENPLVLARDVKEFRVEFWGPRSREWEKEWLYTNQLPKVVRFTLAYGEIPGQSREPAERVSRVVTLYSQMVPAGLQAGGAAQLPPGGGMGGGVPGGPGGPGTPGTSPPGGGTTGGATGPGGKKDK